MMLTTVTPSAAAPSATAQPSAQPAPNEVAVQGGAADAALPQLFAQWLGQQAGAASAPAAPQLAAAPLPPDAAVPADATPAKGVQDAAPADDTDTEAAQAAQAPDTALLAAMAMPLMPLSPAQVAQAVQAAQPAPAGQAAKTGKGDAAAATPAADFAAPGQDGGRRAALAQAAPLPAAAAPLVTPAASAPAAADAAARPGAQQDGAAVRLAVRADAPTFDARDGADADGAAPGQSNGTPAGAPAVAGAAPAAQAGADSVKLAGPPTAWRQSLQEALGERLQLQVGRNVEQAVIRLEPPQLGRIDIAIRHSAGVLEVNISATNGEVLRQLQNVSDNLRSDLSQRQYSEVAVTVAPAPRGNAAPFGDPQQQGRGRQQGRDQEESAPGGALAEASQPGSVFSLGGRD